MLIALATAATLAYGWVAVPFSLLVIGSRQRALGTCLHDASHRSLDGNRRRSRLLANVLFCWPLWVSMAIYRDEHNRHHKFLGDPRAIPTSSTTKARCRAAGYRCGSTRSARPQSAAAALLGHPRRMDAASHAGVVLVVGSRPQPRSRSLRARRTPRSLLRSGCGPALRVPPDHGISRDFRSRRLEPGRADRVQPQSSFPELVSGGSSIRTTTDITCCTT
jgi:hypothetical protein